MEHLRVMVGGHGAERPAHPLGRGLCRPSTPGAACPATCGASRAQSGLSTAGGTQGCRAELYPFKPWKKCPFGSRWHPPVVLHYLLTFTAALLPLRHRMPCVHLGTALYLLPSHLRAPRYIRSRQTSCQAEAGTAIPARLLIPGLAAVCPSTVSVPGSAN